MYRANLRLACAIASLSTLIAFASGAAGQTEPASNKSDVHSATCELHVWPTDKFVVTENLGGKNLGLAGTLLDQSMRLKSPEGITEQLKNQIGPAEQERIIKEIDIATLFRLPGYNLVIELVENLPILTPDRLKSDERISKSQSKCYAEMVIISQQYLHQPIGTRLRTFIWYREYNAGMRPKIRVLDTTAAKAADFPAKRADDIAASTASVQAAFRENLFEFAKDKLKR